MDGGRVAFWPSMRSLSSGSQSSIATSPIALPNSSLGSRGECSRSGSPRRWESSGPASQWSLSCCANKLRDFVLSVMRRRGNAAAWGGVVLATLAILVATLHAGGTKIAPGWSFSITSGDAALAELIQNLLLFIPLGLSLTLAGVRPLRVVAIGALLSFAVEFAQQWIPGRDPSVGDIVCNSISTALGVALVLFAPQWLTTAPRRSAWQALATAVAAVLVWIGTGAMLRQSFPPPPYHTANAPELNSWGRYQGQVLWSSFAIGALSVRATAPSRPPGRAAPLVAVLDPRNVELFILAMDGRDLSLSYHMPAIRWTLGAPDLRWRGAFANVAPGDTFTAATSSDGKQICLGLNGEKRVGFGYTVGDGWKLIFDPERWPGGVLTTINALWIAGCVIGVGFWAARTSGGEGRREAATAKVAVGIVLLGLIVVPWITGLNGTTVWEWIGALAGIEVGLVMGNRFRRP